MTRFGAGTGALVSFGLDGGGVVARPSSIPLADGQSVKPVGAKSGGPGPHYPGKKEHHKRVTTKRPHLRAGVAAGKDTERGS